MIIERRKEGLERLQKDKLEREERRKFEEEEARKQEEAKRLKQEEEDRNRKKIRQLEEQKMIQRMKKTFEGYGKTVEESVLKEMTEKERREFVIEDSRGGQEEQR